MLPSNGNGPSIPPSALKARLNERDRLVELWSYRGIGTGGDQRYDELALLAARICQASGGAVGLIDSDCIRFTAQAWLPLAHIRRAGSFSEELLRTGDAVSVNDTAHDGRFRHDELQAQPVLARSYAGVPVRTPSGAIVGTLLVVDRVPRAWSAVELQNLTLLAHQAGDQLEYSRNSDELAGLWAEMDELRYALHSAQQSSSRLRRSLLTDGICQELAGLLYLAEAASTSCGDPATCRELDSMKHFTRDLLQRVSELENRHTVLAYRGLRSALESLAADIADKHGLPCKVRWVGAAAVRDYRQSYFLWRVAMAAGLHAAQTGGCSGLAIHVVVRHRHVALTVAYDGNEAPGRGSGLSWLDPLLMLAAPLSATITVRPDSPAGTLVRCILDMRPRSRARPEQILQNRHS